MMNHYFYFIILCLFPLGAYSYYSQSPKSAVYEVKGQAVDSVSKQSIPYETISFALNDSKNVIKRMACDLDGKFSCELQQPGHYIITFQSIGYVSKTIYAELKEAHSQIDLGKIFFPKSNEKLNEVVVSTIKPLVSVETDKIIYNAESDPESKTATVLDILRKTPLITVDADDNIKLKGSSSYKIQINGKNSTLLSGNAKDVLKSMPASSIKNIEVITNPSSKYDAEGIGGIINIVTNRKKALGGYTGTIRAGVGTDKSVRSGLYTAAQIGKLNLSVNYNVSYRNGRSTQNDYFQENYNDNTNRYLSTTGRNKNSGPWQYGSGEASYELDSLNLISFSFNRYQGNENSRSSLLSKVQNANYSLQQAYDNLSDGKYVYGSTSANIDYQKSFKKPDELLTFSYLIDYTPNDSKNSSDILNDSVLFNYTPQAIYIDNHSHSAEHTFQADYADPITKIHNIEVGLKAILRRSKSDTQYEKDEVEQPDKENNFHYNQDIYAAYASYHLKLKKLGFRSGVRFEHTRTEGEFVLNKAADFDNHYTEYIPSAMISYNPTETQSMRFSYTQRIERPGIWYLNPYVNDADPKNISYGNPKLDPEKSNAFDLSLSNFTSKWNVNLDLSYSASHNSIQGYTKVINGVSYYTYDNIGSNQYYDASFYGSLTLGKVYLYMNSDLSFRKMKSPQLSLQNSGWGYNTYCGLQYSFPWNLKLYLNGGYDIFPGELQSKSTSYYFSSFGVNKDLFKKKVTVSLSGRDMFWYNKKYTYTSQDTNFYRRSNYYSPGRCFSFNISYRFGELKEQVKKAAHGINNDDLKAGGNNSSGSK